MNYKNDYGDTPLHYAATSGYYLTCLALIRYEASLSARNHRNELPYDCIPADLETVSVNHNQCGEPMIFDLAIMGKTDLENLLRPEPVVPQADLSEYFDEIDAWA